MILETQQNSDITYRVYDYDGTDANANGNKRELHLNKSIEVTTVPSVIPDLIPEFSKLENLQITTYVRDLISLLINGDFSERFALNRINFFN